MDRVEFNDRKQNLINLINGFVKSKSEGDNETFNHILSILNNYTFEERLKIKGLLSHTLIDSFQFDSIAEQLIIFDNDI